ncbi:hypothetical protein [Desulforamulus ruminis]|uniref:hypothetical protein n=1 Tax=Desulforamulus ruminis TaxID=1564 RepID=UPI0002F71E02|nr:hypothetical protein [Desulforamulus ruminis]
MEKAETFLNYGVLDGAGNKVGKGLKEILRPVEKDLAGFRRYIVAKHAQEINTQKMSTGIRKEDADAVAAGAPFQYRQTLEDLVKYQDAVLNQLVEARVMTPQSVKAMREKCPNSYPFTGSFRRTRKRPRAF